MGGFTESSRAAGNEEAKEADGQDVSGLLIQEGLAVVYDGSTKGKDWCEWGIT